MTVRNVLIVDDEESITWTLATGLRRKDPELKIYQAQSGLEAFACIKQLKSLDLLITDIHMPNLSGIELLEKIQTLGSDPVIFVMTGFGTETIHDQVEKLGAVRYFPKPFDVLEMIDAAFELLAVRDEKRRSPGFTGLIRNLKILDILQLNHLIRQTGLLKIQCDGRDGKVYFVDGEIVHAEARNCFGEDAVYQIMSWESGSFEMLDQVSPEKTTITREWEFFMFEFYRRRERT
mgnify:CR=1 FL=1